MRVLLVEDEAKMATLLRRSLEREGYEVDVAETGADALDAARTSTFDLVLLDAMIPPPDGFEVCRTLRDEGIRSPVIMLTARDAVADRVAGLDAGADDYLTKPFALSELYARVRAVTRREAGDPAGGPAAPARLSVGDLTIDPVRRSARRGRTDVALSAKEFALLEQLVAHAGTPCAREDLLRHVWGDDRGSSNVLDVYIGYLRDKIDRPFGMATIRTVRGIGFELMEEPA